jgi:hypothetical protein
MDITKEHPWGTQLPSKPLPWCDVDMISPWLLILKPSAGSCSFLPLLLQPPASLAALLTRCLALH